MDIKPLNYFYYKYKSYNNFSYLLDYFLEEYADYLNIKINNNDKLELINKSEIKYDKKIYNILNEIYQPITQIRYEENIIKNFIEWKFIYNKSLNEFIINNNINDRLNKILNKINNYNFEEDKFIDYSKNIIQHKMIDRISFKERINPTLFNRIIDQDNIYSYLCYYKATINFFLTNKIFLNQYMIEDNIITSDSPLKPEILNDIDNLIHKGEYYQKEGNESHNFFKVLIESNHIKEIKLFLDNLIPKYKMTYPGIIHYPGYLINNIIFMLSDNLTLNSEFYDLSFNNYNYNLDEFKNITNINTKKINKYYKKLPNINIDENYFINKFNSLNKTKKNILIHCPINSISDYYIFDNLKKNKLSFNQLYILSKSIKSSNNISIKYPFIIDNYYLDSFIIVINKGSLDQEVKPPAKGNFNSLDCHFSFIKIKEGNFKLMDSYNHQMLNSKQEFILDEKEIIKDDYILDNLTYKVIFVSYMKFK